MLLSAESALDQERRKRKELEVALKKEDNTESNGKAEVDGLKVRRKERILAGGVLQVLYVLSSQEKLRKSEANEAEARHKYQEKISKLEERLQVQDLGDDDRIKALEKEVRNQLQFDMNWCCFRCQFRFRSCYC